MALPFSVEYKFFRCQKHFHELQAELHAYYKTNPCGMVREQNSSSDRPTFTFQTIKPIPARVGLIVGDFVQNLRSTLDYLVWELVLVNGDNPDEKNMFPICTEPASFKNAMRGKRLRGVHPDAVKIIDELQPLHLVESDRERTVLFILDRLANINKHRHVLLANIRSYITSGLETFELEGEKWVDTSTFFTSDPARFDRSVTPEEVEANAQILAFVSLNERAIEHIEVVKILDILATHIRKRVLSRFEQFF
jgi:hypothetical protein